MTKRLLDISLEIPIVLKRLTLLRRRLAAAKIARHLCFLDLGTYFLPQSTASNLPFAHQ